MPHFSMNLIFSCDILNISLFMLLTPYRVQLMDLKGEKKKKKGRKKREEVKREIEKKKKRKRKKGKRQEGKRKEGRRKESKILIMQ